MNPVELLGGFMSINAIVSLLQRNELPIPEICQIFNISRTEIQDIIDFMNDMESDPFEPRADDCFEEVE